MPLHPQTKAILEALAAEGGKPIEEMTPQEVRASRAQNAEAMAAMAGPEQPVARVENRSIPGPGGPIPVRIYWPLAGKSLPALVYLHGGGWVFGNLASVDRNCRVLANSAMRCSQCRVPAGTGEQISRPRRGRIRRSHARGRAKGYARRLQKAGVPVMLKRYAGAIHIFFQMGAVIDSVREAVVDAASALRNVFASMRAPA